MGRLDGKICVVTGGAMGIGAASVRLMAREGACVAVFDTDEVAGHALVRELLLAGQRAGFWRVDVTQETEIADALRGVAAQFGPPNVLVNNAGIAGVNKPTHEVSQADWDRVQAVNVKGVFLCTKHAVPYMLADGGSIINLSSIYGLVGAADVPPYHASKGAVTLMTRTDALIYAPQRIRVNSIHPGYIWTPMVEGHLRDSGQEDLEAGRRELAQLHPIGRVGEPEDIGWGVVYLASDESAFMTGAQLVIDGGYTAR